MIQFKNLGSAVHYERLSVPKRSQWKCIFLNEIHYHPLLGKEPNRFHRFMQELCFGVKWVKDDDDLAA